MAAQLTRTTVQVATLKSGSDLPDVFDDLVCEHYQQIQEYRRIESQRLGGDIGWDWAVAEWMAIHFPDWQKLQWDRMVADTVRRHYLRFAAN